MMSKVITSLLLTLFCSVAFANSDYNRLVAIYGVDRSEEIQLFDKELRKDEPSDVRYLWDRSVSPSISYEDRISSSLALIDMLYPEGDLSRWNEIGGLLLPEEVPKSLMAIDAFYSAIVCLSHIEKGEWLASSMLKEFSSDSRAKLLFITRCPTDVAERIELVAHATGMTGYWTCEEPTGNMPLARKIRKSIGVSRALSLDVQFLNSQAVPSSNGPYGWDRRSGTIYRIVDRTDGLFWYPW